MGELGGTEIQPNPPLGGINNKRLRGWSGEHASNFPSPLVVDKPINNDAH